MKKWSKIFTLLWHEVKPSWGYALTTFLFFGLMVVLGDGVVPILMKNVTDQLVGNEFNVAIKTIWVLLGVFVVQRAALITSMQLLVKLETDTARRLDTKSMKSFTEKSFHFYVDEFTGSLVDKVRRLGENMINIVDIGLFSIFMTLVSLSTVLYLLFRESILIGILFIFFGVIYSILVRWMMKRLAPQYKKRSKEKSKLEGYIADSIGNIQSALYFGRQEKEYQDFLPVNESFLMARANVWRNSVWYQDTIGFVPRLFFAGIMIYSVQQVIAGILTVGSLILIFTSADQFTRTLWHVNKSIKRLTSALSDCEESIDVLEHPVTVLNAENPEPAKFTSGQVSMQNINFTYPQGEHVFETFNLNISAGQSIGVVGKSGSGKTTITKLLLRLYDVGAGIITIDDQNIADVAQSDLRQHIAYIPQETSLFHRSIFENIKYGNPNATDDQVYAAAKMAHVDEFVQNLENGYDTIVGERGIKLSGGQRQRIGIARAMLKHDAPILIMDEATSALDSISEEFIQQSFQELSKNRTTIVIAHRLSTIKNLDRIIVLDQGVISEEGTHAELLHKNGHYTKLWNTQSRQTMI